MPRSARVRLVGVSVLPLLLAEPVSAGPARAAAADEVVYAAPSGSLHVLDQATHVDAELPGTGGQGFSFEALTVSPDGSRIAWVDSSVISDTSVQVYDRMTHAVRTVYGAADRCGRPTAPGCSWTRPCRSAAPTTPARSPSCACRTRRSASSRTPPGPASGTFPRAGSRSCSAPA